MPWWPHFKSFCSVLGRRTSLACVYLPVVTPAPVSQQTGFNSQTVCSSFTSVKKGSQVEEVDPSSLLMYMHNILLSVTCIYTLLDGRESV